MGGKAPVVVALAVVVAALIALSFVWHYRWPLMLRVGLTREVQVTLVPETGDDYVNDLVVYAGCPYVGPMTLIMAHQRHDPVAVARSGPSGVVTLRVPICDDVKLEVLDPTPGRSWYSVGMGFAYSSMFFEDRGGNVRVRVAPVSLMKLMNGV